MNDKCNGCSVINNHICNVRRLDDKVVEKCPCNECLIKPMCSIRCRKREDYYSVNLYKIYRHD